MYSDQESASGEDLPRIGLGTGGLRGQEAVAAVIEAISIGYHLFDTAESYGNEEYIGKGLAKCGLPRSSYQVITKVAGRHHGYAKTIGAVHASLLRLGMNYLDICLIHWPLPAIGLYVETWGALIQLQRDGVVRKIGVSNFAPQHIAKLERETGVIPAINQIESHPRFPQDDCLRYLKSKGITTMAWSPLCKNEQGLLSDPTLRRVSDQLGKTPAQVVLRWHIQRGVIPLPKSRSSVHRIQNFDIFSFHLSSDRMSELSTLSTGLRRGGDPCVHEEF